MDGRDNSSQSPYQIIEELRIVLPANVGLIEKLQAIFVRQDKLIKELSERTAELERRLGLNSTNSSKPPSSDGFKKPPRVQSLREKSGRKPGGQFGHKGATLMQVEAPDLIEQHKITCCPECKMDLKNVPVASISKRQVFEVPEIKRVVTEHQFEVKFCPGCHKKVEFPKDDFAKAPAQYGNRAMSIMSYLNAHHLVPEERVTQVMQDVFQLPISVATVESSMRTCSKNVESVVEKIEEKLKKAPVKCTDETSVRIDKKINWVHTLSNENFTHYRVSEKRGDIAKELTGVVTHDHFAPYYAQLGEDVEHSLCNAHHLRELKAVSEIDKEPWARRMIRLLLFGYSTTQQNPQSITSEWLVRYKKLYFKIICEGLEYHDKLGPLKKPARGRIKRRTGHNLLLRLKDCSDDTLRFLFDPNVPFTNNNAEQALRMVKVKQKTSGCFRTRDGAESFLNVRSYTSTAQKQGVNVFDAINSAFKKSPIDFAPT